MTTLFDYESSESLVASRLLRQESKNIYNLLKEAYCFIRDLEIEGDANHEREKLMGRILVVVDMIEPTEDIDKLLYTVLSMTTKTGEQLMESLKTVFANDPEFLKEIMSGFRCTAKRTFLKVENQMPTLQKMQFVLTFNGDDKYYRAYARMLEQINLAIKNYKNPIEIISELGIDI